MDYIPNNERTEFKKFYSVEDVKFILDELTQYRDDFNNLRETTLRLRSEIETLRLKLSKYEG